MIPAFSIALEARNPERKHFRSYHVSAGLDLLGDWIVEIRYGRIGTAGHLLQHFAATEEQARAIVRDSLRRRRSAPRRIGAPYIVKEVHAAEAWRIEAGTL